MVAGRNAQTGPVVVDDGPDGGLQLQRRPVGRDEAAQGNEDDEGDIEPVDVLVPVGPRDGQVGDVWLLGIVALTTAAGLRLSR